MNFCNCGEKKKNSLRENKYPDLKCAAVCFGQGRGEDRKNELGSGVREKRKEEKEGKRDSK